MPYDTEASMYPQVAAWIEQFLTERFRRHKVIVTDTSRQPLKRALQQHGLAPANKPDWPTYDILVDITGFVINSESVEFAFVECKKQPIKLRDISQLLGYCRVALPIYACILSPTGVSSDVAALLKTYSRYDVLEYDWPKGQTARSIVVGTWSEQRHSPDRAALIHADHPLHNR